MPAHCATRRAIPSLGGAAVVWGNGKERRGIGAFSFPSTRNYAGRFSPSGLIPVSLMVYLMYT